MPSRIPEPPKYRTVMDSLMKDIEGGNFQPGQRFPSEADLVKRFHVSRITAGRAVRELARSGFVERRAGSGTFLAPSLLTTKEASAAAGSAFGVLIPDLDAVEIFDPICRGMAGALEANRHPLLWGHLPRGTDDADAGALEACRDFIARGVGGVFFAPLELSARRETTNRRILEELDRASIPVVLLDRSALPFPHRSAHDLVGIDNYRAGYLITEHLMGAGARRIVFLLRAPDEAGVDAPVSTVAARASGYRAALRGAGWGEGSLRRAVRIDRAAIRAIMDADRPDAFVCANDRVAGELMRQLLALGYRIPEDVRLAGIDDVNYAALLPVPLTTMHQPCREIGEAAMAAMTARLREPGLWPREILLGCELVVRESCGARISKPQAVAAEI